LKKAKCEVKYLETTQLGRQMIPYKGKRCTTGRFDEDTTQKWNWYSHWEGRR